jgi:Xaa-Pro aminopeptidase
MADVEEKPDYVLREFDMISDISRRLSSGRLSYEQRKLMRRQAKITRNAMMRLGDTAYVSHPSWEDLDRAVQSILDKTQDVDEKRHGTRRMTLSSQEVALWRR